MCTILTKHGMRTPYFGDFMNNFTIAYVKRSKVKSSSFLKVNDIKSSFHMKLAMEGSFECDIKLKTSCVVVAWQMNV